MVARRMLLTFVLLLSACGAALVGCELALRLIGYRGGGSFYIADADCGWALRPGAEGWQVTEGRQYIRINAAGFRDRYHQVEKRPGQLRIAVLGDSYVEALQVPLENTFCSILERELNRCVASGRPVEVLNFGVSGYGTTQELLALRRKVWKYHPDVVLLAFNVGNDVFDNDRRLAPAIEPEQSPYYVYRGERLVLDESFLALKQLQPTSIRWEKAKGDLINGSRLVELANRSLQTYRQRKTERRIAASPQAHNGSAAHTEYAMYAPPQSPAVKDAWRVTEGVLLMMRDEVRTHGAEFWIVTLATRDQTQPAAAARAEALRAVSMENMYYPDLRIRSLAQNAGIRVITLAPRMADYAAAHNTFLNGFANTKLGTGHWNQEGHRVAGLFIAEDLCRAGIGSK